jgi:integrase
MNLSDQSIKNAVAKSTQYKLFDGNGLFVIVRPTGNKLWRFKYRFANKEQQLSLGRYPEVSLKDARDRSFEARQQIAEGYDPATLVRKQKAARIKAATNTFSAVAEEYMEKCRDDGLARATLVRNQRFVDLVNRDFGKVPITTIEPFELLLTLKKIEKRGLHETAKRTRAIVAKIFRYAIISGRAKTNPAIDLGEALVSRKPVHHAAIVHPDGVGELLRAIEGFDGHIFTRLALRLLPHLFVRPGELRQAEWTEFDFRNAVWRIPESKMKMRIEHAVPLSRQALAILDEAKQFRGHGKYVFPSIITWQRPMSENTLNTALRRLGYSGDEMTSHGFRSTASTLLNESGKWHEDAIELALSHQIPGMVRGIYHRGKHWAERVEMAQWWSDYLDELRTGAEIIPLYADVSPARR